MFRRTLRNYLKVQQNCRFAQKVNLEKSLAPPTLGSFEFEPFKFNHERDQLIYGYTMEELYGKKYGLKHSATIERELNKDNIMVVLLLISGLTYIYFMRETRFELDADFDVYIHANRNTVRPIPDSVGN